VALFVGTGISPSVDQELPSSLWIGTRDGACIVPVGVGVTYAATRTYNTLPVGHPQDYQDCFNASISVLSRRSGLSYDLTDRDAASGAAPAST